MLGWSQANLRGARMPDDALSLSYDLYYARRQSPSFDIEIVLRSLFGAAAPPVGAEECGGAAEGGAPPAGGA
jgi:lipopolysaccharide/colanic/teichoic acid biosynthesis glycosyltransferase